MNKTIYVLYALQNFCTHFSQVEPFIKTQGDGRLQHLCQPRAAHAVQSTPNENNKCLQRVIEDC